MVFVVLSHSVGSRLYQHVSGGRNGGKSFSPAITMTKAKPLQSWSLSQQSLGERQEDKSPVHHRAHTPVTQTPNHAMLGSQQWALSACLSFPSLFGPLSEREPRPVAHDLVAPFSDSYTSAETPVMVVQPNDTPMHHYHPSINKKH